MEVAQADLEAEKRKHEREIKSLKEEITSLRDKTNVVDAVKVLPQCTDRVNRS